MSAAIRHNVLTVDLEDYFQCDALAGVIPPRYWPRLERRLDGTARRWLSLLQDSNATATFFASDWAAREHAGIIREIAAAGHEIAVLGLFDTHLTQANLRMFNSEIATTRSALEQIIGTRIAGFRLARGAMSSAMLKAAKSAGFCYDASDHEIGAALPKGFQHVPPAAARLAGMPVSTLWQHAPDLLAPAIMGLTAWSTRARRFPAACLDADQPRITALPRVRQVKHYRGLARAAGRVEAHVAARSGISIAQVLGLELDPVEIAKPATTVAVDDAVPAAQRPAISLVVPCYNEVPSLIYLANTLARFEAGPAAGYEVLYVFVDDGSSDATFVRLHDLFGANANAQIVRHQQNRGVAAATMTGINAARTELVGVIDCDCSYDPAELLRMIPLMQADTALVTASPFHPKGRAAYVPAWRLWLSHRLSQLYRIVLRTPLHSYTVCVRLYRKSAVSGLAIRHGDALGIPEILARLDQKGAHIAESPAVLEVRILGHSKTKAVRTGIGHIGLLAELLALRLSQRSPTAVDVRS
jgi:peptidoglycan/xylan/chitin deacetylase (PgdA/CDA1 family)